MAAWLTVEHETSLILLNPFYNPLQKSQDAMAMLASPIW
jgi:hypothetical protein